MHSSHSDALSCYLSQHTPRVSLCPHGNLYLPHLTGGEAGLFWAAAVDMSVSEWHWRRSRNKLGSESTVETTQQLARFGSSELWWHMSPSEHLFAVAKQALWAQHMSWFSYYGPCVQKLLLQYFKKYLIANTSHLILFGLKMRIFYTQFHLQIKYLTPERPQPALNLGKAVEESQ